MSNKKVTCTKIGKNQIKWQNKLERYAQKKVCICIALTMEQKCPNVVWDKSKPAIVLFSIYGQLFVFTLYIYRNHMKSFNTK